MKKGYTLFRRSSALFICTLVQIACRLKLSNTRYQPRLLVDLLVDDLGSLLLLGREKAAEPAQCLVANDERGGNSGAVVSDKASLLVLLVLVRIDAVNVVTALDALVVRKEDEGTGVVVKVGRRLLDDGEALVNLAKGLVANRVGLLYIWGDVTVRLREPRKDGSGEGLVGRVTERNGALTKLIGFDRVNAVADDGVV